MNSALQFPPPPLWETLKRKRSEARPAKKKKKKRIRKNERPIDIVCKCGAETRRVGRARVTHLGHCPVKKWMVEKSQRKRLEGK